MATVPGEAIDYQPGELVDDWTELSKKDVSGWRGPATVIEDQRHRGQVKLSWLKPEIAHSCAGARSRDAARNSSIALQLALSSDDASNAQSTGSSGASCTQNEWCDTVEKL